MKPFVVGCSEKYEGKLRFAILDTSTAKRLCMSQKVMGIPTIAIYENGAKGETILKDGMNEASIEALIQKHI
ncbi:MAG: thioredoxin family protein [Defluviitaleaceae bacterium]|nr:thioredoxin family protein [Defluviitaleaceae bacterium]